MDQLYATTTLTVNQLIEKMTPRSGNDIIWDSVILRQFGIVWNIICVSHRIFRDGIYTLYSHKGGQNLSSYQKIRADSVGGTICFGILFHLSMTFLK